MLIKENVIQQLPLSDFTNLYVVADFDRTITNGSSKTSWSILAGSDLVPDTYIEERQDLYDHYRPIEVDATLPLEEKSRLVKEWFQKHIELFLKYELKEELFQKAATDLRIMEFRPYAKEFITFLNDHNIPLIIISAGIGNFIEHFLKQNGCYYDNVYVSSNKIIFEDGIAVGVEQNIIHSLNKNEVSLPLSILAKLEQRDTVILLGDQPSDLEMVDRHSSKTIYTVGFLIDPKNCSLYQETFDIVIEENDDYHSLQKVLFK